MAGTGESADPAERDAFLPLDADPDRLLSSPDGRLLLAWTQGEDPTLSILDVPGRKRIGGGRVPGRLGALVGGAGPAPGGYGSRIALDDAATTAWAATTEGQLFRIDVASGELETVLEDEEHAFSDVVVDGERGRILLATEEGEILAFGGGGLHRVLRFSEEWVIGRMKRSGTMLHLFARLSGIWGSGRYNSLLVSIDLAGDRIAAETLLETGIAADLAPLPNGRVLVADGGKDRILQYAAGWILEIARETRDFPPSVIEADGERVLVAFLGTPWSPVYEYGLVDGSPTLFPTAQYEFPDETVLDLALLPGGRFAIALQGRKGVLLVDRSMARPFGGFPAR